MAKGCKSNKKQDEDTGVLRLIKFNPDIIEDEKKKPNYLLDDYVGVCVDANGNHELMKIIQVTVTKENIKSTTNVYKDKYSIGDTFQEWFSMGKYLEDYVSSAKCYYKMLTNNGISKLKYCKGIQEIVNISNDVSENLERFAMEYTVPEVTKQLDIACKKLSELEKTIIKYDNITAQLVKECDNLMSIVSEKRAKMVSKGIINEKKINHRTPKEVE